MGKIQNLDKIHWRKRKLVKSILEQIDGYEYVKKVVIFGSSIREDCHRTSDLDIAIEWTKDPLDEDYLFQAFTIPIYQIISRATGGNDDIIAIGYEGELLKQPIQDGVTVYEL